MKRFYLPVFCVLAILMSSIVQAQTDSTQKNKVQFKLGVYYNSSLNYYGRTDSLRSSGFFPVAEIWFTKNLYVTAAPVFIMNKSAGFDYAGSVATAGLRFSDEKNYVTNLYVVKPVYETNSDLVQSALKAQGIFTYKWLNKIINITAGADVKLSDQFDYGVTAGLDHIFRFPLPGQSVIVINPSAYINAGTQQFTKTSYKQNGFLFLPGTQQQVTEEVKSFAILSYEISMPVVFAKGKLQLIANPAYVLPQNLVKVANRPDLSELGKNMFYITVGAKVVL